MKWFFMILKYVCADQSMINFIAGIEQIAAQLKDIGAAVDDTQIMTKILVSLPSSLQYFLAAWIAPHKNSKHSRR